MGKFSDNIRKRLRGQHQKDKQNIEFECRNCLKNFIFTYAKICMNIKGDLQFTPEPQCPRCSSTIDLVFSDFSQEQIEEMLMKNEIKQCE